MAQRRMFAKTIIDSDAFLDMPLSTQSLYFHLSMRGDDEGFINNPRKIQRMIGASDDDLKLLIAKKFIIPFESGIMVIKHWKIHNYIRGDRIRETVYVNEKSQLLEKDNGAYTLAIELPDCDNRKRLEHTVQDDCEIVNSIEKTIDVTIENDGLQPSVGQMADKCQPNVSIGKDRLGKDRLVEIYSPAVAERIVSYLNEKTNTNYKHTTKKTQDLIKARLNEGFTEDDFYKVIDNRVREWLNDDRMKEYLRPITLFSNKFESYLNSTLAKSDKQTNHDEIEKLVEKGGITI